MKRICSIILALCIAFSMVACHSKTPNPTIPPTTPTVEPTEPTVAPTEPTEPEPIVFRQEAPFSKENVSDFYALMSKTYSFKLLDMDYPEYNCYNDTPLGVFEETGIQIFSFEGWRQSFLMFDGKIYPISGALIWPSAMTSAVLYDYDGDGVKDLIIALWVDNGGGWQDQISVFNPVSKEFTRLFYKGKGNYDYVIYITVSEDSSQAPFTVWSVQRQITTKKELVDADNHRYHYTLLSKTYPVTGIAGHLKTVDGSLQFVPYTE